MNISYYYLISILLVTILLRLFELGLSKKNQKERLKDTRTELKKESYFFLFVVLHTSFLISVPLEVFLLKKEFYFVLGILSVGLYIFCLILRIYILISLKENWNVKVLVHPTSKESVVTKGLYLYIRHPNYLVVILEIIAISLFHSAFISLCLFTILNGILLSIRIPFEEKTLFQNPYYKEHFENKKRFIPYIF